MNKHNNKVSMTLKKGMKYVHLKFAKKKVKVKEIDSGLTKKFPIDVILQDYYDNCDIDYNPKIHKTKLDHENDSIVFMDEDGEVCFTATKESLDIVLSCYLKTKDNYTQATIKNLNKIEKLKEKIKLLQGEQNG